MWTSPTKPPASCDGHQFESPPLYQKVAASRCGSSSTGPDRIGDG
jgi:hypothetical protein